jgi:hypothetical protein
MASFMPGEWDILRGGGNLGGLLGGGNLGGLLGGSSPFNAGSLFGGGGLTGNFAGMGGDFLSGAFGMQPNMLGDVGALLGTAWGPLGSFAGSFLGNTFGDLFGMGAPLPPRARANFIYDFAKGNPFEKDSKAYDDKALDYIRGLTDYVGDTAKSTLDLLGIAPSASKFGFGAFKGRTGFALDTDPFVRDINSPGAYNAIGNERNKMYNAAGIDLVRDPNNLRAFGSSDARTDVPQAELFTTAAQSALDTLVRDSISKAGLTNAQVFSKLGLPTELAGFQELLGPSFQNFQFGDLDFAAPSKFTYNDILSAQQLKGLLGGAPAGQAGLLSPLLGTRPFWETGQIPAPFWGPP